ncbi:MAG: glycosyltransferase [Candidatus Roizmanbacteria bacterium]
MISIIIPVYKKIEMFLKNFETNYPFIKDEEIIIVNDDPEISIIEYLKNYSSITLIENEINLGFAGAVHKGALSATRNFLMFLNTDVILFDKTYEKAVAQFKSNPQLFAVSFAQKEKDISIGGRKKLFWKDGFIQHARAEKEESGITAWADCGSCMIDKEKYLKIGGLDTIYSPFYWEDVDLGYNAWKEGYIIQFDREIIVEHHHESTIQTFFKKQFITQISFRNQLLFIWKNITDSIFLREHSKQLCIFLFKQTCKGTFLYLFAFFDALIIKYRIKHSTTIVKSDKEILSLFITL